MIRNNLTATTDPLITSDSTLGYEQGSRWLNTTSGVWWTCQSAAAGAAIWAADAAHRSLPSQSFMRASHVLTTGAGALSATDRIVYLPIVLTERTTFDRATIRCAVAGTAGQAAARVAFARHNPTTRKPGRIFGSGLSTTIALDNTGERPGGFDTANVAWPLLPGLWWIMVQIRGVASPAQVARVATANDMIGALTATGVEAPPLYYERTDAAAAYANFLPTAEPDPAIITPSNGGDGILVALRRL